MKQKLGNAYKTWCTSVFTSNTVFRFHLIRIRVAAFEIHERLNYLFIVIRSEFPGCVAGLKSLAERDDTNKSQAI